MSFYRSQLRLRSPTPSKRQTPGLEKLDRLTLQDLLKIKKFVEKFRASAASLTTENERITLENKRREAANERLKASMKQRMERWENESGWTRTIARQTEISAHLSKIRVGLIEGAFRSTVRFNNSFDVPADRGERFVKEYEDLERKADQIWRTRPEESYLPQALLPSKKEPSPFALMTISGSRVKVSVGRTDLNEVNARIAALEAVSAREKEKSRELKARIADKETQTRSLARPYRSAIAEQISRLSLCPYCSGELSAETAHQDHIHPVCKGGQSVSRNLVFVCAPCNLSKRDMMLGIFLKFKGLSVSDVHARLEALGKDF